jgi:hypothetical protein
MLVDEELARAVRTDSALAVMYWWGASQSAVHNWRKYFDVAGFTTTEGNRFLHKARSEKGAAAAKASVWTAAERQAKRRQARKLNLGQYLQVGFHGPWWTEAELAVLGRLPDEEVASQIGRTPNAVRCQRNRRGIATARNQRRRTGWPRVVTAPGLPQTRTCSH